MKPFRKIFIKILSSLIILAALNIRFTCSSLYYNGHTDILFPSACKTVEIICYLLIVYINFFPVFSIRRTSTARNKILDDGTSLLQIFLATTAIEITYCIIALFTAIPDYVEPGFTYPLVWIRYLLTALLIELVLFWNGIIRVYLTSVQLGIKWRILGTVCGWIPFVQIYALCRLIRITSNEVIYENEKPDTRR